MAIYRCEVKNISRGQGRSCVAAAAYRSASELEDERQQMTHDYARKGGVEHAEIVAPDDAPSWALDRQSLWNRIDAAEKRKDARTAKEVLVALPRELTLAQQVELVRDFARTEFAAKGLVADFAIHAPDALDGEKQPHAHIMIATRALDGDGFAKGKDKSLDQPEGIESIRERWATHANRALERAGLGERIDHRSLERQRADALAKGDDVAALTLDRQPEPKIGPVAMQMVRAGRADQAHAFQDVQGVRQERTRVQQIASQVIDMAKAGRALVQQQAQRLAALGGRLDAAMQAAKERVSAALTAPTEPQAETDKATAGEWGRLFEARASAMQADGERQMTAASKAYQSYREQADTCRKAAYALEQPRGLKALFPSANAAYKAEYQRLNEQANIFYKESDKANSEYFDLRKKYDKINYSNPQQKYSNFVTNEVTEQIKKENPDLAKRMEGVRERQEVQRRKEIEQRRAQTMERLQQQRQRERGDRGRGGRGL